MLLAYRNAAVIMLSRPVASLTVSLIWLGVLVFTSATALATIIGLALAASIQQNTFRVLLPNASPGAGIRPRGSAAGGQHHEHTDPLDPDSAPAETSDSTVFGGVEAGGTKWVCAKGTGPRDLTEVKVIPTTTPPETLGRVVEFFKRDGVRVAALGVGSFGPVDLRAGIGDVRLDH